MASAATFRFSKPFEAALKNPMGRFFTDKFIQQTFVDGKTFEPYSSDVVERNQWASLGRQVAAYITTLVDPSTGKSAFEVYGNFINCLGHILVARGLEITKTAGSESYVQSVRQVALEIFQKISNSPFTPLNSVNISFDLNRIDVPEGNFGQAVPLCPEDQSEQITKEFAAYMDSFKTTIVTRDDISLTSGSSLRAVADADQWKAQVAQLQNMFSSCGLFEKETIAKIQWMKEAVCMIIEGKEIDEYTKKQASQLKIDNEVLEILRSQVGKTVDQGAIDIVFSDVMKRMEKYVQDHPYLKMVPGRVLAYLVQDFYPRSLDVKLEIDREFIDQAREAICPGISPIQYPRINYAALRTEPMNPILSNTKNFLEYLNDAQAALEDRTLAGASSLIQRQIRHQDADLDCLFSIRFLAESLLKKI